MALFIALLFLPAGRLDWYGGWAFLFTILVSVIILSFWMRMKDPELFRERQQGGENVKRWDQFILAKYYAMLIVLLVLAGLDAGRFGWSSIPRIIRIVGWAGLAFAMALIWWVLATNTYLSSVVRIQEDRDHQVISDGPYQFIRHPMYFGIIVAAMCVPLALGSWWSLIPAFLIVILFIIRTAFEDRTLQSELPGYHNYTKSVRYRLFPGVW
ncbi:MAG: isoprenylcysteine carboxylmethyltransferase family protein [Anaerolineales bacterium]